MIISQSTVRISQAVKAQILRSIYINCCKKLQNLLSNYTNLVKKVGTNFPFCLKINHYPTNILEKVTVETLSPLKIHILTQIKIDLGNGKLTMKEGKSVQRVVLPNLRRARTLD